MDFGIREKIQNYGTAVTVGVFIGTALTTGIAAGIAGWYALNKGVISSTVSSVSSSVKDLVANKGAAAPAEGDQAAAIAALQERVTALENASRE